MAGEAVIVGTYPGSVEASMALGRLEGAGIRAVLANEESVGLMLGRAIGGVKLLVTEEDATRAVLLLADPADEAPPTPEEREGIQADPPSALDTRLQGDAPEPGEADGPDEEGPHVAHLDETASRASRSALFGLLFFPLSFYAIYLVLDVVSSDEQLTPKGRRDLGYALFFLSPYFLVIAAFAFGIAYNLANP